ncbi:MAG: TetR/AcrR family transcriptional regulator [Solirubrobacteraceae bacterium]|nr:TetR/AcrR family transcriptional regulator [Solirubrobacteraceae bacterium]
MERTLVGSHPDVGPLLSDRAQRARLLDAIVDVVAAKGYEAATVADVVKTAKVSRGTFYELFESKQACFAAAYLVGTEVLERRVTDAVRGAADWRDELRLGLRAYLTALVDEPRFARVFLAETRAIATERDDVLRRFAARYGASLAKSGRPAPPDDALFVLASGVDELAHASVRAGRDVRELEETLVGCCVRFASEEEPWT